MKGLFLSGYGCKPWIWENVESDFNNSEDKIKFIEWPTISTRNFNELSDFSSWVKENYLVENEPYDFIVGHSMGGIVALQLSTMERVNVKHIVLVESYITSPGKFFQNIVMENTNEITKKKVMNMLKQESKYYSPDLGNQLKNIDLTYQLNMTNSDIHFIYGDRGINNREIVLNALGLNSCVHKHLDIQIISNSCHFPMLENSEELLIALKNIL